MKEGENLKIKKVDDKPMIIHYWATWCGACVEEMPALARFAEQNSDNIRFVIIASDHSGGREVKAYCDKNGIKNNYIKFS